MLLTGGALIGWFANQYMEYRTVYKEALTANYQQFTEATAQIEDSLKQLADVAQGERPKSEEDLEQLQMRLLKALNAAEDLERRMSASSPAVDVYRTATIQLKQASDRITGPLDAKPLVEAVNSYLLAEKMVRDSVIKEHNAFLF
ncbi:hypothetical protein ABIA24_003375 [Sinorhizobium fredii]|uniref:hypothetical protein n=1 Tax=Rhizobium fredii TaxID=380 RepID=UPI003515F196